MTRSDALFIVAVLTLAILAKRLHDFARRHGADDPDVAFAWMRFDELLRFRALAITAVLLFLGAVMTWRP